MASQTLSGPSQGNTEVLTSTVDTSAVVASIIGGDPSRVEVVIVNTGANDVYVNIDPTVSATNGLKIVASGGALTIQLQYDYAFTTWGLWAVSPNGASSLFVLAIRQYEG